MCRHCRDNQTEENIKDIEVDPLLPFVTSATDEALLTSPEVDPNDPEEIARIIHESKNMNVFERIESVNKRKYFMLFHVAAMYCLFTGNEL